MDCVNAKQILCQPLFSLTPTKKIVNSPRYCPIEFKELDRALAEEKTKNRRLAEELSKNKSEANYYKREGDNYYYFITNLTDIYITNLLQNHVFSSFTIKEINKR
jgi:hypothetical protein